MAGASDPTDDIDLRFDRLLELARRPDDPADPQAGRRWQIGEIIAALRQAEGRQPLEIGDVAEALVSRPAPRSREFLDQLARLLGAPSSYFDPMRPRTEVEAELLVEQLRRCGVSGPLICRARLQPRALVQTLEAALQLTSAETAT